MTTNFEYYLDVRARFGSFCPWGEVWPEGSESAQKAFDLFDSRGIRTGSSSPKLVAKAVEGKKLANFMIGQWAEEIAEYMRAGDTVCAKALVLELDDYNRNAPSWVMKAVLRQAKKLLDRGAASPV